MLIQSWKIKEMKNMFLKSGFSCLRNQVGLMTGSVDAPHVHVCVTHWQALMRLASWLNKNRRVLWCSWVLTQVQSSFGSHVNLPKRSRLKIANSSCGYWHGETQASIYLSFPLWMSSAASPAAPGIVGATFSQTPSSFWACLTDPWSLEAASSGAVLWARSPAPPHTASAASSGGSHEYKNQCSTTSAIDGSFIRSSPFLNISIAKRKMISLAFNLLMSTNIKWLGLPAGASS